MGLKSFNPYTASRRFMTVLDKSHITKETPEKNLLEPKKRSGGRNSQGEIVIWHRGGGHKKQYRVVDFRRDKDGVPAKVASIEYDPNRSANIALLHYADGDKRYILHPVGLAVGATVSTGASAQLLSKEGDLALVKMPSGEVRKFSIDCRATVGQIGNLDHENQTYGKAGRTRWKGVRPTVRGVAMNPVDHPHGGGEGKVKGNHPQTPWAFPTLGKKTRHNKRTDRMISQRRK